MKHNLPVEILGDPPPPKRDPVFELKQLPDTLKYPADFLVLGSPQDDFCPIILNTVNAKIDCKKDVVTIGLGDMSHDFNFAKFRRQPHDK